MTYLVDSIINISNNPGQLYKFLTNPFPKHNIKHFFKYFLLNAGQKQSTETANLQQK